MSTGILIAVKSPFGRAGDLVQIAGGNPAIAVKGDKGGSEGEFIGIPQISRYYYPGKSSLSITPG